MSDHLARVATDLQSWEKELWPQRAHSSQSLSQRGVRRKLSQWVLGFGEQWGSGAPHCDIDCVFSEWLSWNLESAERRGWDLLKGSRVSFGDNENVLELHSNT